MRTPANLLRRFGPHLSNSGRPRVLILLYHRVADITVDPWLLAVSPDNFREHLACLREEGFTIRRPAELSGATDRTAVITFDDGYADNSQDARTLLEEYEAPATFFVVTNMVDASEEYWWDELERIFLNPGTLPESLTLSVGDAERTWDLGTATAYTTTDWLRYRNWRAWEPAPGPRQELYTSLYNFLFGLQPEQRATCVSTLRRWSGVTNHARPGCRCLRGQELQGLAESQLFVIGSHTVTHPRLSSLPAESQQVEIESSKRLLDAYLPQPVTTFSYPFGRRDDYSEHTIGILRQNGFTCACANFCGPVRGDTDPYQLPRHHVENWDGDQFGRHLRHWLS